VSLSQRGVDYRMTRNLSLFERQAGRDRDPLWPRRAALVTIWTAGGGSHASDGRRPSRRLPRVGLAVLAVPRGDRRFDDGTRRRGGKLARGFLVDARGRGAGPDFRGSRVGVEGETR